MANVSERHNDNVPGRFYTDADCVLCNECFDIAPEHFKMAAAGDHMIVYKQPVTPEETALCKQAMEGCPMEAIGDDGDAGPTEPASPAPS